MSEFIARQDLLDWLRKLSKEYRLIAPQSVEGVVLFRPVVEVEKIAFDCDNTDLSPKEYLFAPAEVLFTVERRDGGKMEIVQPQPVPKSVIFGIRPCDAMGIAVLDKPFLSPPADALYAERRQNTTLIGLACKRACAQCFCTSFGTAPDDPKNVDILLAESDDGFTVRAVTEKGKALLTGANLKNASAEAQKAPVPAQVPVKGIEEVMRRSFELPYWSKLADRCIHCNVCSYVCPTCYCFDIRDYTEQGKTERVRSWESCQSPGFTKLAGGHDPRGNKGAKLRQRFYHKLLYMPEQWGAMGCVGCGRCVRSCPVNIDIREIITDIQKLGEQHAK